MNTRLLAILITITLAAAGQADVIRLHSAAEVAPGATVVTLADVAALDGDYAAGLGEVVVASLAENQSETRIDAAGIRTALTRREVHWGKLILRGATRITVARRAANQPPLEDAAAPKANTLPALDRDSDGLVLPPAMKLREYLTKWLRHQLGDADEDVLIQLDDAQQDWLGLSLARYRFEIEPIGRDMIGRVSINVRRYQGGRFVDTNRIRAEVKVRRKVVIAARSIGRGQTITASDIEEKVQWFDSMIKQPASSAAAIIGQQVATSVRTGSVLYTDDIRAPVLVQRGQLVTVRCISGSLVLKTVARANEDGVLNQLISLRNERTRSDYTARVSGSQEAIAVTDAGTSLAGISEGDSR
ncbi:flagellar basal body P-ring formation protein FlgA [Planctomycetales bacterium ZRK34]|nr:flagellar basal body P-ring formation protein FlgA [Planctomycetales bacterium ZRK34]